MKFNNINVQISAKAIIGKNVRIGDNTIIYDNVVIGDNTIVCNNCVLGEPTYNYYSNPDYENPILEIGANSMIRSNSLFYAGSKLGNNLQTGHNIIVRENTIAGSHCSIGSFCDVEGDCLIGDYSRLHSYVALGKSTQIGKYTWVAPYVVFTNDPTPPSEFYLGVKVGDFCMICASAVLLPGTIIQDHSLVAANSTVGGTFEPDSLISGSPAIKISRLSKAPLFNMRTKKRHYPWPQNFDRGMPWAGIGFDEWANTNK